MADLLTISDLRRLTGEARHRLNYALDRYGPPHLIALARFGCGGFRTCPRSRRRWPNSVPAHRTGKGETSDPRRANPPLSPPRRRRPRLGRQRIQGPRLDSRRRATCYRRVATSQRPAPLANQPRGARAVPRRTIGSAAGPGRETAAARGPQDHSVFLTTNGAGRPPAARSKMDRTSWMLPPHLPPVKRASRSTQN
jgi:hypothetical protein